jgi:hypothetical protein
MDNIDTSTYTMLLANLLLDEIRHQLSRDLASLLRREEILERHSTEHTLCVHIAPDSQLITQYAKDL